MHQHSKHPYPLTSWPHKLAVLAGMTLLAVVMTWPLAAHLRTAINDYGDPLLNAWILWWDVHALSTPGLSLFNAPIFHPAPLTLAYSENLLASAAAVAPLLLAGVDAVLAHNLLFLASFALAGFGAYLLGYQLSGSRAAALVCALGYGFAPFRFAHLGHLQLLTSQYLPLALLFLHRWALSPRWPLAAGFGIFWLAQTLSCGYYGLFTGLAVGLFILYYGLRGRWWRQLRRWLQLTAVAVGLLLVLVPLMMPYLQVKRELGFVRTPAQAASFAAELHNYLAAPPANRIYGAGTARFRGAEGELFVGLVLAGLALAGLLRVGGSRRRGARALLALSAALALGGAAAWLMLPQRLVIAGRALGPDAPLMLTLAGGLLLIPWRVLALGGWARARRAGAARFLGIEPDPTALAGPGPHQIFYLLLALLAVWGSLGPGWGLYALLYHLPGFDSLRVPARMALLVTMALAVLAGFGARNLMRWLGPGRLKQTAVLAAACALILAEACSAPIPWQHIHRQTPAAYRWLAKQPPAVVMEVPTLGYMGDFARDAHYLYWSSKHHHTLANGYSGFFPPRYQDMAAMANRLPDPAVLPELRRRGVDYLLVHLKEYPPAHRRDVLKGLAADPGLTLVWHSKWAYVYRLAHPNGKKP